MKQKHFHFKCFQHRYLSVPPSQYAGMPSPEEAADSTPLLASFHVNNVTMRSGDDERLPLVNGQGS